MAKRIIIISVYIFIGVQNTGISAENGSTVDNLIANYANNAFLAPTIVNTAGQCIWERKYEDAEKLYRAVIDIHPNNPYTTKARVGLARLDVLNLIEEKKYSLAQQQVDLMAKDFNDEPELPVAMFHIGKEFTWQHRYSEATETFGLLLKQSLNNTFSQEAKLWLARAQVCSLIGQAKDEEVVASTDKLISDFENDAGLPEAIYWISKEYEWTKGTSEDRTGWFDKPNSVFQRLIQKFGYTSFGMDAEWDQKRLKHRMGIFKLMKEADQNTVDAEIGKMVADLKGRQELPGELYWIACGYEEQPGLNGLSKKMYERIVKEYPDTMEADNASLDIRRLDIWDKIQTEDVNEAEIMTNKFVADFNQHSYAGVCLGRIAYKCYMMAMQLKFQDQSEKATWQFNEAIKVWKTIIENLPISPLVTPDAWFFSGVCYSRLGLSDDAVRCYKEVSEKWPEYRFAREASQMAKPAKPMRGEK